MQKPSTARQGSSEPLLSPDQAAAFVGLSVHTLNNHRALGRGPAYTSVSGRVAYRVSDLQAWMSETDGLLDTAAAADLAGCSVKHLQNLRSYGAGPVFIRMKGIRGPSRIFYRSEDVLAWRAAR